MMIQGPDIPPKLTRSTLRQRWRKNRAMGVPSAIDLLEEGVHLLGRVSIGAWSAYLCGLAPFFVGFLFFWMEMASSGLAESFLVSGAFLLAGLFLVFKLAQVRFAMGLRDALYQTEYTECSVMQWLRSARLQMIFQPWGLIAIPVASVVTIPLAWVFTYFQNLILVDPKNTSSNREISSRTWAMARIWHEENWILLSLLTIVSVLTFLNCLSVLFFVPFLLKTLLGVETVFSRAGIHLLDSSVLFTAIFLTYAIIDPLVKAVYMLRLHYAESRQNGSDLQLRLERLQKKRGSGYAVWAVGLFVCLGLLGGSQSVDAAEPISGNASISVSELDNSIDTVLTEREFIWRFPREEVDEAMETPSWFTSFFETLKHWRTSFERWLDSLFRDRESESKPDWSWDGIAGLGPLLSYTIIGAFVLLLLYVALQVWKNYKPPVVTHGSAESLIDVVPDLNAEEVLADALPRNEWIDLAQEMIRKGEFRLALRAYFLAQLSAFSADELIVVLPAKSNREYASELAQRGHERTDLIDIYKAQVRLFESVWYGNHVSGPEDVGIMEQFLRKTKVLQ